MYIGISRSAERDSGRERPPREDDGHKHLEAARKRSRSKDAQAEGEHVEDDRAKRQKPAENGVSLPEEVSLSATIHQHSEFQAQALHV